MQVTYRAPEVRLRLVRGAHFHDQIGPAYDRADPADTFDFRGWSASLDLVDEKNTTLVQFASSRTPGAITLRANGKIDLDLGTEHIDRLVAYLQVAGVIHGSLYGNLIVTSPDGDSYLFARVVAEVASDVEVPRRKRRNIIPNPAPVGTAGWNHSETNATLIDFSDTDGLHYEAVATAAGCQTGVLWNDASEIVIAPGENYGLTVHIDVESRPVVGQLRYVVLWKAEDGVTPATAWFSQDIPTGATDIYEVIESPAGAYRASVSILYTTVASDTPDLVTHIEVTGSEFLFEPLGPPLADLPGAVTNHVLDPSVEYGGYNWLPHTHDDNLVLPGTTYEPQTGGASHGTMAMRQTITATGSLIPSTTFYGFIGSYVGALYDVVPGDEVTWQCDVEVLAGPPTGPGVFLEIFFYFYDGDPAHTVMLLHENGDSIFTPLELGVTKTLDMTSICPVGANVAQVTVVMASGSPSALLDFYADRAMVTINQTAEEFFAGDSPRAGWDGVPGRSTSRSPGRDAILPGPWFSGASANSRWEGAPNMSASTTTQNTAS